MGGNTKRSTGLRAATAFAASVLVAQTAVAAPGATVVDVGTKDAGKTYPLALEARNEDCPQPLDFQFISGTSWIKLPGDAIVRQVPQGQARPLNATLDFANVAPGNHTGTIEVECANCGWFVFKSCKIDKQTLEVRVRVITPGPSTPTPQPNGPQPNVPPPGIGPGPDGGTPIPPPIVPKPKENPAQPLQPARPGDPGPEILPNRMPEDIRLRLENAQRALEDAKRAELPCRNPLTFALLKSAAQQARDQADKAKKAAEAAEREAAEAQKKADEAEVELDKATQAYKDLLALPLPKEGTQRAFELSEKKKAADQIKDQKFIIWDKLSGKADKARERADRAQAEAKEAEEKAKAADAALKAKQDECAKLKATREAAERELADAKAAARPWRKGRI